MHADAAARPHWTTVLGLVLLWGAFLAVAYVAALLTVWHLATVEAPAAADTGSSVVTVLVLLGALAVLVLATLRRGWARWVAVGLGLVLGALGLLALVVTRSPAPETVAMAGAAIAGAVLLALPPASAWYARRRGPARTADGRP